MQMNARQRSPCGLGGTAILKWSVEIKWREKKGVRKSLLNINAFKLPYDLEVVPSINRRYEIMQKKKYVISM